MFHFEQIPVMAPRSTDCTGVLFENDPVENLETSLSKDYKNLAPSPTITEYKVRYVWRNIILFLLLHVAAIYGAYLVFMEAKLLTNVWGKYSHN